MQKKRNYWRLPPSIFILPRPPWYMWATSGLSRFLVSSFSDMAAMVENDRTLRTRFVTYETKGQARVCFTLLSNLPLFPNSYKNSHFQNEGRCKIFPNFICMRIWNIFQTSTFALSLGLTLSIGATLNLPIQFLSLFLFISFFLFFTCILG